jgi:phasin family protein
MTKPLLSTLPGLESDALKKAVELSTSTFGKVGEASQQNLQAAISATTSLAQGLQSLGVQALAYSKATAESHVIAAQALASAKSPQEAIEVQTAHVKASIERFVNEVSKISDTYSSSVKSAAAPLRERVAAALKAVDPSA